MNQTLSAISTQLRQISLFGELSDDELVRVSHFTRERQLHKGELLFQRGDAPQGFYFVQSGQIKLAFSSVQGNEKVVEIIGPGQSFGEAVMFLERPYPVFAEALSDSTLLHIKQGIVSELIDKEPGFARKLLAGMAVRLHNLVRDVEAYSLSSSTQRVIGYLIQLADRDDDTPCEITLPTSKQVIASRLNLTPETLSRIFHDLVERKLISVHGKRINLHDPRALSRHQG